MINIDNPLAEISPPPIRGRAREGVETPDFHCSTPILTFPLQRGRNWFGSNGLFGLNISKAGRFDRYQAGFTLIELVVFMVIVSIGVVGILSVMNTVVKSSADPMIRKQSAALADSILAEILLKEYTDPDGGANVVEVSPLLLPDRALFDDVDDYNGQSNALFTDLPAELATYTIGIVVAAPATLPAALNGVIMKRVVVTVTHGAEAISMTGYRANY